MTMLESLVTSGRIVDIALAFLVIELVILVVLTQSGRRRVRTLPLLVNAGAGGSLMLALRAALTDAGWPLITSFLLAALVFHGADVALRFSAGDTAAD